jgi:hypothetical protein
MKMKKKKIKQTKICSINPARQKRESRNAASAWRHGDDGAAVRHQLKTARRAARGICAVLIDVVVTAS